MAQAEIARPITRADRALASRTERTRRLLHAPIGPTLARLSAPNVIAMVVTAAMSVAEGFFAGQLGIAALAGLALVFPLVMLTQMMSGGAMGGAISSSVARALGNGDEARAGALVLAAWVIAAGIAVLAALLMAVFGRAVFSALGGEDKAVGAALAYAGVFFPGAITLWLCQATLSAIRGTGDMLTPSLLLLGVAVVTIPIAGTLSLGWGPFPALGMAGLASGTVIAHGLGALVAVAYVLSGRAGLRGGGPRSVTAGMFSEILRVGLIASLNAMQTVLTIVLMVGLVGRFGTEALAGYGLGSRLEFLMVPVVFGIGSAMVAMVGANIGAGNRARALRVAWTGAGAAALIVGGIGALVAVWPDLWLGLFLDPGDTGALEAGRAYFRRVGPFYGFFALGLALYFASQGAGRMIWPVVASLCRMAVAFGGALWLVTRTEAGLDGIFVSIAGGMFVYGGFTALAIALTRWR
ncbi:MAG: MATE family efflux transporter [Pseudooceanicola sp.]